MVSIPYVQTHVPELKLHVQECESHVVAPRNQSNQSHIASQWTYNHHQTVPEMVWVCATVAYPFAVVSYNRSSTIDKGDEHLLPKHPGFEIRDIGILHWFCAAVN